MNIKGGTLSDLTLVGGTIDGTTIKNASFLDGDTLVPIGEIATTVSDHEQRLTQVEADIGYLSSEHDKLSSDLSGVIDDLSVELYEKLDGAVADIERSIGGVVTDVKDLSDDLGELSGKLETLSTSMLNGVVYKGKLPLTQNSYDNPGLMFYRKVPCCLLNGTQDPLVNGWMFKVVLDKSKLTSDYVSVNAPNTLSTIYLGEGDYVIIKNHNINEYKVIPDETMRMDDFDIINAQDEDDTKLRVFKQISSFLNEKIETLSTNLSNDIDKLSSALSGEIDSLSGKLSNLISSLSGDLCAEIELDRKKIKEVSAETLISANAYTDENIT
jgi:archaellum component FlaC